MLRTVLSVILVLVCIALVVVVLMQKGRDSGLGALSGGSSESFWSKNKGRSREGMMILATRVFAIIALILVAVLNITRF